MSRGAVQLRVAGFPTTIQPMFLLVIGLIGWYPGITPLRLAIWVAVAVAAILWHELGHASAARRLGAAPTIELYGFGGITRWQPPRDPSRRQLIGVTLAGPGAGFLVGSVMALAAVVAGGVGSGDLRFFVLAVLWTNVGWGLVNLLPVLPLDGGHVMAELLPGDRATRHRRAAALSIAIGAAAALLLIAQGIVFGGLIFVWAAFSNFSALGAGRASRRQRTLEDDARAALDRLARGDAGATAEAVALLPRFGAHAAAFCGAAIETAAATGNAVAARAFLDAGGPGVSLAPGLYALVFAVESGGRDGVSEMTEIFRRDPTPRHARWLAVALHCAGRTRELATVLGSTPSPVDPSVIAEAAHAAENLGHPVAAAAVRAAGGG